MPATSSCALALPGHGESTSRRERATSCFRCHSSPGSRHTAWRCAQGGRGPQEAQDLLPSGQAVPRHAQRCAARRQHTCRDHAAGLISELDGALLCARSAVHEARLRAGAVQPQLGVCAGWRRGGLGRHAPGARGRRQQPAAATGRPRKPAAAAGSASPSRRRARCAPRHSPPGALCARRAGRRATPACLWDCFVGNCIRRAAGSRRGRRHPRHQRAGAWGRRRRGVCSVFCQAAARGAPTPLSQCAATSAALPRFRVCRPRSRRRRRRRRRPLKRLLVRGRSGAAPSCGRRSPTATSSARAPTTSTSPTTRCVCVCGAGRAASSAVPGGVRRLSLRGRPHQQRSRRGVPRALRRCGCPARFPSSVARPLARSCHCCAVLPSAAAVDGGLRREPAAPLRQPGAVQPPLLQPSLACRRRRGKARRLVPRHLPLRGAWRGRARAALGLLAGRAAIVCEWVGGLRRVSRAPSRCWRT